MGNYYDVFTATVTNGPYTNFQISPGYYIEEVLDETLAWGEHTITAYLEYVYAFLYGWRVKGYGLVLRQWHPFLHVEEKHLKQASW